MSLSTSQEKVFQIVDDLRDRMPEAQWITLQRWFQSNAEAQDACGQTERDHRACLRLAGRLASLCAGSTRAGDRLDQLSGDYPPDVFSGIRAALSQLQSVNEDLQQEVLRRTQAEAALRIKEAVIASSINGIAMTDMDGRITYVNEAALRMWGFVVESQVLGRSVLEFWADASEAAAAWSRVSSEGAFHGTLLGRRADGSVFHVQVSSYVVADAHGSPACITGTLVDVSEWITAREELERSRALLAKAQDLAHIGSWSWDLATGTVSWSEQMYHIYGLEPGAAPDDVWSLVNRSTHRDDKPAVLDAMRRVLDEGGRASLNFRILRPNGDERFVHAEGAAEMDDNGRVRVLVGVVQDVTEQTRAEQALRDSEARLRSLVEHAPDAITMFDVDTGRIVEANARALALYGMSRDELYQADLLEMSAPTQPDGRTSAEVAREYIERALRGETPVFEWLHVDRQGREIPCEIRLVRMPVTGRRLVRGSILDISARKRAEHLVARLGRLLDQSSNEIYVFDSRTLRVVQANRGARENTGYADEELQALTLPELAPRPGFAWLERNLEVLRRGDQPFITLNLWFRRRDGSEYPARVQLQLSRQETPPVFLMTARDITESQRTQAQMTKLSSALEQTADAVMITDAQGVIEYVNPAFTATTGYTSDEVVGNTPCLLASGKHEQPFYRKLWRTIKRGGVYRDVVINRKKDGSLYYEEKTISPLKDEAGHVTHFISTGKDITERMQTQQRLHYLAYHDVVTDLPNRSLLMERLEQALGRGRWRERQVAVMFLDLDRFKNINDTLGHEVGDQLLQKISRRLLGVVRDGDTVARLGGDEFAILLDDVAVPTDVAMVAQKVLNEFATPFDVARHELFITTSIGISVFPADGVDAHTLVKNADAAMYRAKQRGRNTYQFYTADMTSTAYERLAMENQLRRALERDEFLLYYQPQYDLLTGEVQGVEALLRWQHPTRGIVTPTQFVGLLEETGLIMPVGEWVLRTATREAQSWQHNGTRGMRVAVNLSGRQLADPSLLKIVDRALEESGLSPQLLEVEITETTLMENPAQALETLRQLKQRGIGVAIDDFGTGYSSLSYLKRFPIDTLKIDQSFVRDIATDADDAAIVSTILAMADSLKLSVVAEGVETDAQLAFLRDHRCHNIQGYLFSPPLPPDQVFGGSLHRERHV